MNRRAHDSIRAESKPEQLQDFVSCSRERRNPRRDLRDSFDGDGAITV